MGLKGLKDLKLPSAEIEVPGGKFTVRGLSLDDIAYLIRSHKGKLGEMFDEFQNADEDVNLEATQSIMRMLMPLLETTPRLIADVIACAAGDADDWELAAQLPFPYQVEAIEQILVLTFSVEGGPKKVLETVIRLAQGTTALVADLGSPGA